MEDTAIQIDMGVIEERSTNISGSAECFKFYSIEPRDYESTITANSNETVAACGEQQILGLLGSTLDKDAANIKNLGLEFIQYDQMLATMYETKGE